MTRHRHHLRSQSWCDTHSIEEQEIAVGLGLWQITGTLTVEMSYDEYGADADGRRGVMVTDESDRTFTLASAALCQPDGEFSTPLTGAAIPADVILAAEQWADTCEPPDPDPYEGDDEPDYDPVDEADRRERRLEVW
jgi:hypothetical protein